MPNHIHLILIIGDDPGRAMRAPTIMNNAQIMIVSVFTDDYLYITHHSPFFDSAKPNGYNNAATFYISFIGFIRFEKGSAK
jgi:hypothetical protein